MKPYRSAIIGCGGRGRMHALAYEFVQCAELTACCDLDPVRRNGLGAEFGILAYQDPVEMIEKEKPDLVHLVTAPSTRVELMSLVDRLGVPACIVEKPVALEVRDWKALVEISRRTRTLFGVGAQFRYHPDLTRCREALQSGRLGKVRTIKSGFVHNSIPEG